MSAYHDGFEDGFRAAEEAIASVDELLTGEAAIKALSEATRTAPYPWDADDQVRCRHALAYVASAVRAKPGD